MCQRRKPMSKIREILRLKWTSQLSNREIAKSCSTARSTVAGCLERASNAALSWPLPEGLDDTALDLLLYPPVVVSEAVRAAPEWSLMQKEMRKKNVTLALLWDEYKASQPNGYQYSQFCKLYREFTGRIDCCMRQCHMAGEKLFVDYCGQTVPLTDPEIPARVRKPRDKAKAEAGVQLVQRWILAVLRNRIFFSLDELNQAIALLLIKLNAKPFRKISGSRESLFAELDKPALAPLPTTQYQYAEWTPDRLVNWAAQTGESTAKLVDTILAGKVHPQQGFISCMGIISLSKKYGKERVEAGCKRALAIGGISYTSLKSILVNGLDSKPLPAQILAKPFVIHPNIRGNDYYN